MGFMKSVRANVAQDTAKDILKQIPEQDGYIHVAMFVCFGSAGNTMAMGGDAKFNTQANDILSAMQAAGLQVLDVKFECDPGQGVSSKAIGYHVLVTYK